MHEEDRRLVGRVIADDAGIADDRVAASDRDDVSGASGRSARASQRPIEPVQYVSLAYTETLAEHDVAPSVGTEGDSCDNALAETVNGLYKAELIYSRTAWPSTSAVELATLEWVTWWNHQRLHEALEYRTPVEVEAAYDQSQTRALVTT